MLCAGGQFTFTIDDSHGDGICCGYGEGSFTLSVGGVEVFKGGDFGSTDSHTFTAWALQPSAAPTTSAAPSTSAMPTPPGVVY